MNIKIKAVITEKETYDAHSNFKGLYKIAYDRVGRGPSHILVSGAFSYRRSPGKVLLTNLLSEHFTVYNCNYD